MMSTVTPRRLLAIVCRTNGLSGRRCLCKYTTNQYKTRLRYGYGYGFAGHMSKRTEYTADYIGGGDYGKDCVVDIVNRRAAEFGGVFIDTFSNLGIRLSNNIKVIGPCVLFANGLLHWNVMGPSDVTPESLSLFPYLYPKLDMVIIGAGDSIRDINPDVIGFLRSHKIGVDVLPTSQACGLFNWMMMERRNVAACLIPPRHPIIGLERDEQTIEQLEGFDNQFKLKYIMNKHFDDDAGKIADVKKISESLDLHWSRVRWARCRRDERNRQGLPFPTPEESRLMENCENRGLPFDSIPEPSDLQKYRDESRRIEKYGGEGAYELEYPGQGQGKVGGPNWLPEDFSGDEQASTWDADNPARRGQF